MLSKVLFFCIFLSMFLVFKINFCYSQPDESVYLRELNNHFCGTTAEISGVPYFPVNQDTLKILIVFAKYPDDTWDPSDQWAQPTFYWRGDLGNQIPSWATGILKSNTNNIGGANISNYFKEASRG